ncbi:MAG TPA: protein translocase subunit SecD [Tepiditoga sp.]|nr:protein translocase subunit SecD [Thermotogota bacterium]HOO73884.1 protein translocase subunit SecD [Tepiditoga sp.]
MRARQIRLILTIAVIVVALLGLVIPKASGNNFTGISKILSNVKLGLDIKGGSLLEYNLKLDEETKAQDIIDNVVYVLRKRLDAAGYTEASVSKIISGNKIRVRVEIPGISDTKKAEELVGSRGKLYFGQVMETKTSDVKPTISRNKIVEVNGTSIELYDYVQSLNDPLTWYRVKTVFEIGENPFQITGSDVIDAKASVNSQKGGFLVSLKFNSDGAKEFALATGNLINERLAIVLDDKVIIAPTVNSRISDGNAVIENITSVTEAQNVAALIKGGNLPVDLVKFQERTLGPTLGADIVSTIVKAGIIGLAIVMVYMIFIYGWMGVVADIALLYNTFMLLGIMGWTGAILTLPGIAGIILTFGTTVDGNIIIYERIKEELRSGKPSLTSVKFGFEKAFWTLFDANLTTVLAGIVLYYFSTGVVRGFAVTLVIGVLGSMFTNLVVSRIIMESSAHLINTKKYYDKSAQPKEVK